MAKDVIMPVLGMNQDSGVLVSWLKAEGDTVAEGEPLMEVETDKAVMEIEATASGTLVNVTASEGDEIPTGTVIARIVAEGEAVPDSPAEPESDADDAGEAASASTSETAPSESETPSAPAAGPTPTPAAERDDRGDRGDRVMASPKARRLAAERGVDLASLAGTGPDGAVIARDVPEEADAEGAPEKTADAEAPVEPTPDVRPAPAVAPTVTTQLERTVDAGAVAALLERLGERRDVDPAPTLSALLVKFAAAGARRRDLFGDDRPVDVVLRGRDERRVVARASELGLTAIAERLTESGAESDPEGEADEPNPLHLTVTVLEDVRSDAVRDAAEGGAALGVGSLEPRVIAVDGEPTVRPTLTLTLTADPQRVDSGRAAQLFDDLVGLFADPTELVVLF